jgi:hypothetical protein
MEREKMPGDTVRSPGNMTDSLLGGNVQGAGRPDGRTADAGVPPLRRHVNLLARRVHGAVLFALLLAGMLAGAALAFLAGVVLAEVTR